MASMLKRWEDDEGFMVTHSQWAEAGSLKPGDRVNVAGAGSGCLDPSITYEVKDSPRGLYIDCKVGAHFLDGSLSKEPPYRYLGFTKVAK